MDKGFEHQLRQAIDRSRQWASVGWPVTFGDREVVVSSLSQAQELPVNAVHRLVAVGYWQNVNQIGYEAATWGEKALRHLANNDLRAAEAAAYYASYLERPLARHTRTWQPISSLLQRILGFSPAPDV